MHFEKQTKSILLDVIVQWTNVKFPEESAKISLKDANEFVENFYEKHFKEQVDDKQEV